MKSKLLKVINLWILILLSALSGCSSVEITENDFHSCAKGVFNWLQQDKPEIEDKNLFVTVEDIELISNNFPKAKLDVDKAGGSEKMFASFKKNRLSHHGYCRRSFAKSGIYFKDLSFLSYKVTKKELEGKVVEYDLVVYLKHPTKRGPIAFSFDAFPIDGKLKLTDGNVLKVYSENRK